MSYLNSILLHGTGHDVGRGNRLGVTFPSIYCCAGLVRVFAEVYPVEACYAVRRCTLITKGAVTETLSVSASVSPYKKIILMFNTSTLHSCCYSSSAVYTSVVLGNATGKSHCEQDLVLGTPHAGYLLFSKQEKGGSSGCHVIP